MFDKHERDCIIGLIKREVVPAIGCTEPIAVALCVARATELLGGVPERIEARLSANILKNAMGVGIPGTGMVGLPIAIALGATIGRSEYQLEVLKDCTPEAVERGKAYIAGGAINISLKDGISEKLYIEIEVTDAAGGSAMAIIAGGHTTFVYERAGAEVLKDEKFGTSAEECNDEPQLSLRKVYDFAMTAPLDEIRFILETRDLNKAAAEKSFAGRYGHQLGRVMRNSISERKVLGDNTFSRIVS